MGRLQTLYLCLLLVARGLAEWPCLQCDSQITDETIAAHTRWDAAEAEEAWNASIYAWNRYEPANDAPNLDFVSFVSNFFGGPPNLNCMSVIDSACSVGISCATTKYPAGYLILNSLFAIHQIAENIYWTINLAQDNINVQLVADTFAPLLLRSGTPSLVMDLLAGLALFIGFLSAYSWNIAIREANIFTDPNRLFSKDIFNSQVLFAVAIARDHMRKSQTAVSAASSVNEALHSYFNSWLETQASYTEYLFNGSSTSISFLWNLIEDGMMLTMPNNVSLTNAMSRIETVAYAQLIQFSWQKGPGNFVPFVLKSGDSCETSGVPLSVSTWMTEDTANSARVCWNDNLFFVLSVNPDANAISDDAPGPGFLDTLPFIALPGGTNDVLDGTKFGGVTLMDIVESVYGAYLTNNQANGYQMATPSEVIDNENNLVDYSISQPGFFNIPLCTSVWFTVMQIGGYISRSANFPC